MLTRLENFAPTVDVKFVNGLIDQSKSVSANKLVKIYFNIYAEAFIKMKSKKHF